MEGMTVNKNGTGKGMGFLAVIILLISVGVGAGVNVLLTKYYISQKRYPLPKTQINLPVPMKLLQSPLLTEWSGGVGGKVTAKTDTSFTIQAPDNPSDIVVIHYMPGKTTFQKVIDIQKGTDIPQTYNDLKVGDQVNGLVDIKKIGTQDWSLEGKGFIIQ